MKRASLLAAAAIVLVANAFGLLHAWQNRSGPVETEITLTQREIPLSYKSNDEDSGVALNLTWMNPYWFPFPSEQHASWLDQKTLKELGFDTALPPSDDRAMEFYQRQRPKRSFVALEYDGPAWSERIEALNRLVQQRANFPEGFGPETVIQSTSRLIAIDASNDAAQLRARHPDRTSIIIVPAVVSIGVESSAPAIQGTSFKGRPAVRRHTGRAFLNPRSTAV